MKVPKPRPPRPHSSRLSSESARRQRAASEAEHGDQQEEEQEDGELDAVDVAHRLALRGLGLRGQAEGRAVLRGRAQRQPERDEGEQRRRPGSARTGTSRRTGSRHSVGVLRS